MSLQSLLDELNQFSNKKLGYTDFIIAQGVAAQIAIAQRLDRLIEVIQMEKDPDFHVIDKEEPK